MAEHHRAVPLGPGLGLQHAVDGLQRRRRRQQRAGQGAQGVAGGGAHGGCLGALAADVADHEGPGALVEGEDVEEVAADLAPVAGRDEAHAEVAPHDVGQARRHHGRLERGGDARAVVEDLLQVLLVADPLGHVAQHQQLAGDPPGGVVERPALDVEGPTTALDRVVEHHALRPASATHAAASSSRAYARAAGPWSSRPAARPPG